MKTLQDYIEEEITTYSGQTFSDSKQALDWVRKALHRIAKITIREYLKETLLDYEKNRLDGKGYDFFFKLSTDLDKLK